MLVNRWRRLTAEESNIFIYFQRYKPISVTAVSAYQTKRHGGVGHIHHLIVRSVDRY